MKDIILDGLRDIFCVPDRKCLECQFKTEKNTCICIDISERAVENMQKYKDNKVLSQDGILFDATFDILNEAGILNCAEQEFPCNCKYIKDGECVIIQGLKRIEVK